jgi:Na+/H+-dicarboxylate symporter
MTDVIIKLVHIVMLMAPVAVFALIAKAITDLGPEILGGLFVYSAVVVVGLILMIFGVYPSILRIFAKVRLGRFYRAIAPAQLLAFSSSSSSATLPVTMECVEHRLGVSEDVTSFAIPLGATINMDGTALYQGVATLFIAQLYGMDLTVAQQLTIVLTATLASIGTAGVPGVGMIMLVIVLQSVGMDLATMTGGIAIIFAVDRILDMCRTTCNVTGDCMVAAVVASTENELLTEEEVMQRREEAEAAGLDEHPKEGGADQYGVSNAPR